MFVTQCFTVLDGVLEGRSVEFTEFQPEAFTAWVPAG
jgi:hypothetical protein